MKAATTKTTRMGGNGEPARRSAYDRAKRAARYAANRDACIAYSAAYYAANKAEVLRKDREQWHARRRAEREAAAREAARPEKERRAAYDKAYRLAHKDELKAKRIERNQLRNERNARIVARELQRVKACSTS